MLAPDDGVVAHLVALLHAQELRPQKAPDFIGNGIAKELKHWGLDSLGRILQPLALVKQNIVPQNTATTRIIETTLQLRLPHRYYVNNRLHVILR